MTMRPHSNRNATAMLEEKRREEKRKKESRTSLRQPSADIKKEALDTAFKTVTALGFPIYALIGRYRKVSRLKPEIPSEVLLRVCEQYIKYKDRVINQWPWFLRVLKAETERYMAKQSMREGAEFKKAGPLSLEEILRRAAAYK